AFEDIRPVAPTHVLVIPKEHIPSVHDLSAAHGPMLARMFVVANRIADERKIDRDGYRIVFNKGPQAGQSVYHLHLHLLGGRALAWPPGYTPSPPERRRRLQRGRKPSVASPSQRHG